MRLPKERWAEVDSLFDQILQRPADERTAFLRATCGEDTVLYEAVNSLLESERQAEAALGESATVYAARMLSSIADENLDTFAQGTIIGHYEIKSILGRGGMGTVYLASRADGAFEKDVALKVVKRGMDTDEVLRRFQYERQILAGLDHPNIARLVDAGATDDGRPYLVMEVARGIPLTRFAVDHQLDVTEKLLLFEKVCEAVAYAHKHSVVHRDLKPGNILVEKADDENSVKLLDFGIARLLAEDGRPTTRPEQTLLTPEYAAPEQLNKQAITTATDVYSLGVVLYELIVGQRPSGTNPRRPSTVLTNSQEKPRAEIDRLRKQIRGDLDTLVMKALDPDPDRRYETATALLEDLRRHRKGLPLRARPATLGYRTKKFIGRNKGRVTTASLIIVSLIALLTALSVQQREVDRSRESASVTAEFLESLFAAADPFAVQRQDTLRVRDMLAPSLARVRDEFADQPETRSKLLDVIGQTYIRLGLYPEAESPLREAVELRRAENDPPILAASLIGLSRSLAETGQLEESVQLSVEATSLAEPTGDQILLGNARRQQGLSLTELGRLDEARSVLLSSLDQLKMHFDDHVVIAETEEAIARLLLSEGDVKGAEFSYASALDRYARLYGPDDPHRLSALRGQSFVLMMAGRLDESEATGAEAVRLLRETRPGSGSLANMLSVYGAVLRRNGKLDLAAASLEEAITLPPRRPADPAVPLGTLATVREQQGRLNDAIELQKRAYDLLAKHRGNDDPSLVFSGLKLAKFYTRAGEFESSEELLLSMESSFRGSSSSVRIHGELVALYNEWGRSDEAARWKAASESPADSDGIHSP